MGRIFARRDESVLKLRDKESKYGTNLKIGIVGLGEGVGTTFVATALAFCIGAEDKSVSYVELGSPATRQNLFFDSVAMDRRFANREFFDFYQGAANGDFLKRRENREMGINWCIITPENCRDGLDLSNEELHRLIGSIEDEICIFDIESSLLRGKDEGILMQMDIIIGVVDPMPSKMLGATEIHSRLERTAAKGVPLFYVVNKNNSSVVRKEVHNYLKTNDLIWVPLLRQECFFDDEYNCRFHWNNKEINRNMVEPLDMIVKKTCDITKHSH